MRAFVAGQQRYLPELLALLAPTINLYARLVPGFGRQPKQVGALIIELLRCDNSRPAIVTAG